MTIAFNKLPWSRVMEDLSNVIRNLGCFADREVRIFFSILIKYHTFEGSFFGKIIVFFTVLCISVGPRPHGLEIRVIFDCFSWDKSKTILRIDGFEKRSFFESAILDLFFNFFFSLSREKQSKVLG